MNHVAGIDISDRSIELVTLLKRRGAVALGDAVRAEVPPGLIERGVIRDMDVFSSSLSRFFDQVFGTKKRRPPLAVALPETLVYSKVFTLPANLAPEMAVKAILIEANDVLPISLQDAVTSQLPIRRGAEEQQIFFAAAERQAVAAYVEGLSRAGAKPLFLDSEALALVRALTDPAETRPLLIADIGARTTLLAVVDGGALQMSSTVMAGGDLLVAALERKFGISLAQAEKVKRDVGFDPAAEGGRPFLIMQRPAIEIIGEIRRTLDHYHAKTGRQIGNLILAGGTSLTPRIVDYFSENLPGLSIARGEPFRAISLESFAGADALKAGDILYATAAGLALRAIGARASPGIDLTPGVPGGRGNLGTAASKAFAFIASLPTMVTRSSKSHKKKQPPPREEPAAEQEALPEALRADAPEEPATAPQPAEKAAMPEPVAPEAAPPAEAAAPAPKVWVNEGGEEKDYGHGIGDLLGSTEEIPPSKVDTLEVSATSDKGKLSIESILSGKGAPPAKAARKELARPVLKPAPQPAGSKSRTVLMVFLVLLLFLAAATGLYLFAQKMGWLPLSRPAETQPANEAPAPAPAPAAAEQTVPESVSLNVIVSAAPFEGGEKPALVSRVIETDVSAKETFTSTGETTTAAGRACGTATIINTTSRSYTFVATTRLLSKEGVLFRMKDAARIPADGTVDVYVCADQPGPEGNIGPTTFTIPGLSPEQQKLITAKSDASMTGGGGKAKAVSQGDLDAAKAVLAEKLKKEALANMAAMLADGEKLSVDLVTSKEISVSAPKAGTAASTFTMTLTMRFRALLIPEQAIAPLLTKAFADALPPGVNAADYSLGTPFYTVLAYDTAADRAEVRVEAAVMRE